MAGRTARPGSLSARSYWRKLGQPSVVRDQGSEKDGGLRFVVSHPFHDKTVEWMGHPARRIFGGSALPVRLL